jgi:hypothetical protein
MSSTFYLSLSLTLLMAMAPDARAERTICISNSPRNCSFVGPPHRDNYEDYVSHSHTPQEVASSSCAPKAVESIKVLADETGNSDRKMMIEVSFVGEDSDFNVCVSQKKGDCPSYWPPHKNRFVSCPEKDPHISNDRISDLFVCPIPGPSGQPISRAHRQPIRVMSDVGGGFCGTKMMKVICINAPP